MFNQEQLAGQHNRHVFSQETIDITKQALAGELGKAGVDTTLGLVGYPLEAPSKKLYPVLSPIRNRLQRISVARLSVGGMAGTALNWKVITAINAANVWGTVSEGQRNGKISYTSSPRSAAFKTFGLEGQETDEAVWAGMGYEDVKAFSALSTLQATMVMEEKLLLGGNLTDLGAPTGLAASGSSSGGSLATATTRCKVSALTMQGLFQQARGNGGSDAAGETSPSTNTSTSITGPTGSIALTWDAVRGAVAYNVYVDINDSAGYKWTATVYVNAYTVTAQGSGNPPNSADQSGNGKDFDGLIPQIEAAGAGYYKSLDNATLTADGQMGIVEIQDMLQSLWDNSKVGPQEIWVGSQEVRNIAKKLVNAGASSLVRVVVENSVDGQGNLLAGVRAVKILNPFTGEIIDIIAHPDMPPGKMLALTHRLPEWFPNNNVGANIIVATLQEYADYEFARTTRAYEHGVYASEVMPIYAPSFCGVITNIKNG